MLATSSISSGGLFLSNPPQNSTRTGERVVEQMRHGVGQVKATATDKSEGPRKPPVQRIRQALLPLLPTA